MNEKLIEEEQLKSPVRSEVPAFEYNGTIKFLCPECGCLHTRTKKRWLTPVCETAGTFQTLVFQRAIPREMRELGITIFQNRTWLRRNEVWTPKSQSVLKRKSKLFELMKVVQVLNGNCLAKKFSSNL